MSKIFKIPCSWEVCSVMEVEANSLEEAIQIAIDDAPLPTDSEYIDGSFSVNNEMLEHFNPSEV
jgi:hypothetical protein